MQALGQAAAPGPRGAERGASCGRPAAALSPAREPAAAAAPPAPHRTPLARAAMEHFIETVRKYPCLWNTTAIEYRDQELKDAAWAEVMKETDLSSGEPRPRPAPHALGFVMI